MKKNNAIEVKNLIKTYGDVYALNDVDLNISDGEYFVLLGAEQFRRRAIFRHGAWPCNTSERKEK